jgi:hypothetical protein
MDEEEAKIVREYVDQLRLFQGARSTKKLHKNRDEYDDVERTLTAAKISFADLKHRGDQDPPDCEVLIGGIRTGIEVTELLHQRSLEKSIKAIKTGKGFLRYHDWSREDFLGLLRERIEEKDNPSDLKDGPYESYFLVIWTGEMYLTKDVIEGFLEGVSFQCSLITDAFISLDYQPLSDDPYPAIRLKIIKKPHRFWLAIVPFCRGLLLTIKNLNNESRRFLHKSCMIVKTHVKQVSN